MTTVQTTNKEAATMNNTLIVLMLILVASGCVRVDTYERAVKKNSWTGAVAEESYTQGRYHSIMRTWAVYDLRERQHPEETESDILDVLTADQLRIDVDAAFRYRIDPTAVRDLYVEVGDPEEVHALVYNTFRSAVRNAVAGVSAANLLSQERVGLAETIQGIMAGTLSPRGIEVTEFFLRGIDPPTSIRRAVEEKLAEEQEVEREQFRTQRVVEQANQRREEAAGIRDAQTIIAESLVGEPGRAFLAYEGLQALKAAAEGENNLIISASEGGLPLMRPIP